MKHKLKGVTVVGARPQFIKAACVSRAIRKGCQEVLVHTGQHYDYNMSDIFFEELKIPHVDYNLSIGSGTHGEQTGEMLKKIEEVLIKEKPNFVMVYGDTNSTLAGALAASKQLIPVIHIEAGLRSYNRNMPEEQNRVLTDHLSTLLFCPTETAVSNLFKESIKKGVFNSGDVMYDAVLFNTKIARKKSNILLQLNVKPKEYLLVTVHRAENTNNFKRLKNIINALNDSKEKIILPLHPRTQGYLEKYNLNISFNVQVIKPVGYLDMLMLVSNSKKVLTDSGGIQKEAYFMKVPCITLRDETEWIETIRYGWNSLVGANYEKILDAIFNFSGGLEQVKCFGKGDSSLKVVQQIFHCFS